MSAASAVALTYLFPGEAAALETQLDEYLAAGGVGLATATPMSRQVRSLDVTLPHKS